MRVGVGVEDFEKKIELYARVNWKGIVKFSSPALFFLPSPISQTKN